LRDLVRGSWQGSRPNLPIVISGTSENMSCAYVLTVACEPGYGPAAGLITTSEHADQRIIMRARNALYSACAEGSELSAVRTDWRAQNPHPRTGSLYIGTELKAAQAARRARP
jgi:hypothetical protein